MKNEIFSSPNSKKIYSFKPKSSKSKNLDKESIRNVIPKKIKEEEKNMIKENIESINVTFHPQEKITNKKLFEKQKTRKNSFSINSKKNIKMRNQNNENKQKKMILNLEEKKNKNNKRTNKKMDLKLYSSKSKNEIKKNKKEILSNSFHSSKQLKQILKKDFYVPTVSASLISPKNKNKYNSNSLFENSFSSNSSNKSFGKGSLKFNEKRKEYIKKKINLNSNSERNILSNQFNINFNYDKVLKDLNSISQELNNE
jgi:hypothetical protein